MARQRFDTAPEFNVAQDSVVIRQSTGSSAAFLEILDSGATPVFTVANSGQVTIPTLSSVGNVSSSEINYLSGVSSNIQSQIDLKAPLANPSFTGTISAVNLTLSGDLTVNGTTTTLNSTTLTVDDKNIELGSVGSPSDITADGGRNNS